MLVAQAEERVRHAVILAAGRGSRMGSVTETKPKCLIELAGRTLLDWQMDALSRTGLTDITLVTGYREELLRDARYRTISNPRWRETNMVRSLMCAREILASLPTVVSYADIVYHPAAVEALLATRAGIALTYDTRWAELWRERFDNPLADAESFEAREGRVVDIGARAGSLDAIQGQYMGLLLFRPDGWRTVEALLNRMPSGAIDTLDMTGMLRALLATGAHIAAVPVSGRWCEVDTVADLALYERRLSESAGGRSWSHDWRAGAAA